MTAMRTLIDDFDWGSTPIGPRESWPQSLRTSLSICLASRFPILIWWGPQLIKLYNDAYVPMLGDKHPQALGAPGRLVWEEIWDVIGPMLEQVRSEGTATWSDDQLLMLRRHGYTEEAYFTFSYSPIIDESGEVGGIFTAVTETTERVLAERRLETLRRLAVRASEATTVEQACRNAAAILTANPQDVPFAVIRLRGGEDIAAGDAQAESHESLTVPLTLAGETELRGVLVAGVNPHRALDDEYRSFFALVAGHISAAIANAKAHELERKFATAFDRSPLALTITSLENSRLVEVNEGFVRLSGYTREEAIGRTPEELGLWIDPAVRADRFARIRAGEPIPDIEARFRIKNGTELVGVIGSARVEIGGRPCILSSVADITQFKRVDMALRESEERYRSLTRVLTSIVWRTDANGFFVTEQPEWASFTGQTFEEHRGSGWANALHPDDRPVVLKLWQEAMANRSMYYSEGRIWHAPSRSYRYFEARALPLFDSAGNVREWIGTIADVTDRKVAEESLRASAAALREADRIKDEFLATLSHELRTPLTAIVGWAQMLSTGKLPDEQRTLALDTIRKSAIAQAQLIDDVLDVSRFATGKMRLEREPADLAAIVEAAVETVRPAAEGKEISLNVSVDRTIGLHFVDPSRIQQILWNLLSNAIKFSPAGAPVDITLHSDGGFSIIEVTDHGRGISADFLPHMFERFRQADSSANRSQAGLGLGLALAKELAELHGGSISVQTEDGRGSRFIVRLPVPAAETASSRTRQRSTPA